jgi:hypothetical protein
VDRRRFPKPSCPVRLIVVVRVRREKLDRVPQAARRMKESCLTPVRYYLRQESGAVIPHAGILCAGGAG